jgi:hypothetical protein
MVNLMLAVLALADIFTLLVIVGVLGLWMKGADSLVFPGLGLIVATPLLLALLITAEVALVVCSAYLVRYIPILSELLG